MRSNDGLSFGTLERNDESNKRGLLASLKTSPITRSKMTKVFIMSC